MKYIIALGLSLITVCFAISCKDKTAVEAQPQATWDVIQEKILNTKCISCHVEGSSQANQSKLILTSDIAFESLINKTPNNKAAADDGYKLIGTEGLESLYKSFFWEKVNAPNQEHFFADHPEYGEIMPPGDIPLTNGEIEFIRQWIIAGAPQKGEVASVSLLDDDSYFTPEDSVFKALDPPATGVQLHLGPFNVKNNYERELYSYKLLGNTEDIYVNHIETAMRPGTHHLILYDFEENATLPQPDVYRDLRDENGNNIISTFQSIADQVFMFGTQFRSTDYQYPAGVAQKIPAGKGLDLNSHYVNYGTKYIVGEVYVNLHTVDKSQVQYEAQNLFLNNLNITLPANKETTLTSDYSFNDSRNIFMLTAHAHQYMTEFKIFIKGGARDGELVYYTDDWEHPEIKQFDPPLELNPGEGLKGEATYNNSTNKTLNFGLLSTDEMMIIFGAYYKK
ncbi:MAG: hypothetical protein KJP21_01230 [Bacteroidia bacterium]|nr:hypothetical protein [Bacteroidia bacterium]NNJ56737.1 hypothetical protein [Bacteroidia bacterium]